MNEKKNILAQLVVDYIDFLINIKGLSKNTTNSYHRDLNKLVKFLDAKNVDDIENFTEEVCSGWIADLFQKNIGPRSIQRHISSAKGFFNYLRKIELIETELKTYDYEHIICDNNSNEKTISVLREISSKDDKVKVILKKC